MNFNEIPYLPQNLLFPGAEETQHPHLTVTADGAFQSRHTVQVTAALECCPAVSQGARGVVR